jgi:predicted dehydrogenase
MSDLNQPERPSQFSRRSFVKTSTAAAVGAAMVSALPSFVHAAEDNTLKIGLVGCGGRGGGAALNALHADSNAKIVALADMFKDKLEDGLSNLKNSPVGDRVDVKPEDQYVGWDAYKGVIEKCDVVLLATPPHFRPMHLKACVDAGKHIFCEKPVATDAPGLRSVMETCKQAKEKNLSLVSGLCYRYQPQKIETIKRLRDGAIGDFTALQCNYLTTGLRTAPRKPEYNDMEWQVRNWLYFYWLAGDLIMEQHIHSLDKIMWVMGDEMPVKVTASGGRACRTAPVYGNVYDHFNTIYEWQNGLKMFSAARQWDGCATDTSDWVFGTQGTANIQMHLITGKNAWHDKDTSNKMYDLEHVALFKSIRNNEALNNGDYMCKSTGVALMGRMSAYTGQTITWDQALNSKEDLRPAKYEFGDLAIAPLAVPGKTKFV